MQIRFTAYYSFVSLIIFQESVIIIFISYVTKLIKHLYR